jgi:glycosyltransferase involved in cell wall biosynthesis
MSSSVRKVWAKYGLEAPKNMRLKAMLPYWWYRLWRMGNWISIKKYPIYRLVRWLILQDMRWARRRRRILICTRSENIAQLLRRGAERLNVPVFIEIHWLKSVDWYRGYKRKRDAKNRPAQLSKSKAALRAARTRECHILERSVGILCLTDQIRRILGRWDMGVPMMVLPSAVDMEESTPHVGAAPLPPIDIVYTGQPDPWKGVDCLIRAMCYLEGRRLVLAGGNKDKSLRRVRRLVAELGLEERVEILGQIPHMDVNRHIDRAKVGVIPLPRKGFIESRVFTSPLKLFEFGARSKAIVASDLPNLREVLVHGENAWLCRPDDPRALAEALRTVLEDDRLREKLAEGAYRLAKRSTFARRAESMLEFFEACGTGRDNVNENGRSEGDT